MKTFSVVTGAVLSIAAVGTHAQNLIVNNGNEEALVGGQIPGWLAISGAWTQRSSSPSPLEGSFYFFAGVSSIAELSQTIDVSAYASAIDAGTQHFDFSGYVRSFDQLPVDSSRIVVTLAGSPGLLATYDSGEIFNVAAWQQVAFDIAAPAQTRSIEIDLISTRYAGSNNDGYYDALNLTAAPVPELPSSILSIVGAATLLLARHKRTRRKENLASACS